jgi:hypothetical protein
MHVKPIIPMLTRYPLKTPLQAWLFILVLLYAWRKDEGILIWFGLIGIVGVAAIILKLYWILKDKK